MKKSEWKQPFTTKRYIHPPMAEEIVTMWPDVKFIIGEIEKNDGPHENRGAGIKILKGAEFEEIDYKEVNYYVHPEGLPIHSFSHSFDGYDMYTEAFCTVERIPKVYIKLMFKNKALWKVSDKISFLTRTGLESNMIGINYDGYNHLNTNKYNWGLLPTNWRYENSYLTDGKYSVAFSGIESFNQEWTSDKAGEVWTHRRVLSLNFSLTAGEEKSIIVVFNKGLPIHKCDYASERKKVEDFWLAELGKIKVFPFKENKSFYKMYRTLVSNCLQMFCYPSGEDYVLPRQGGMQRGVWPTEAVWMLTALDKIGDFSLYTETAYSLFFDRLQVKNGEDKGCIAADYGVTPWASNTGSVIQMAANYMICKGREAYEKRRDDVYNAFCWIERKRAETKNGKFEGYGLMPPMMSCDWAEIGQVWTKTDAWTLLGYKVLAEAFEKYQDPAQKEVREAYNDYLNCMRKVFEKIIKANKSADELFLPMHLGKKSMVDPPVDGPYCIDGPNIIYLGIAAADSKEARMIENYYINRQLFKNGLKGQMNTNDVMGPWAGHTWYIGFCDYMWFYIYLAQGRKAEAVEIINAHLKYAMTSEYYMVERYADNDPYFVPWLPNASENGRFIEMLCDYEKIK